jgi:hypothetical protein
MECCLILSGVVGGQKVDPEDVVEFILGGGNKQHTYPSTVDVKCSVKIHLLVLGAISQDRLLYLYPLDDEVHKDLQFNSWSTFKFDGVCAMFDCPFDDVGIGFLLWRISPSGNSVTMAILYALK